MSVGVLARHSIEYQVNIQDFEGPLDLLLHLIERAEMDITKVAIAQVTDQFLEYIKVPGKFNVELISYFVAIAAKMLQIKSEAILPHHLNKGDDEEILGEDLVQQLKLYKKFKHVAGKLKVLEEDGLHTFLRIAPLPYSKPDVDLSNIKIEDLITALLEVNTRSQSVAPLSSIMRAPRISIRQKINLIAIFFKNRNQGTFFELLTQKASKEEIVVTFLAMLELIKRHILNAFQESTFGDIDIKTAKDLNGMEFIELEFEE